MPKFNSDSLLRAHVKATKINVQDVFALLGIQEPVTGTLEADFTTDGTLGCGGRLRVAGIESWRRVWPAAVARAGAGHGG